MRGYLAAGILGMFLVAIGVLGASHYVAGVRAKADAAGYARRDAEQKGADNKTLKAALADVARLNTELQGITSDAKRQREQAAAAGAAAADAGVRLRAAEARLRAALGAAQGAQAAAAAGSAATEATERVLADVRRRLDEAQDRVAGYADGARIAGLACERSYDALK